MRRTQNVEGPAEAAPDAELIQLGARLEQAWTAEKAVVAAYEAFDSVEVDGVISSAVAETAVIADQIGAICATTLAGLCIKARAVSWCFGGDLIEGNSLNDQVTTSTQIAASVLRDLLALRNAEGPAEVATSPGHGSLNPRKEIPMNTRIPSTTTPAEATAVDWFDVASRFEEKIRRIGILTRLVIDIAHEDIDYSAGEDAAFFQISNNATERMDTILRVIEDMVDLSLGRSQ